MYFVDEKETNLQNISAMYWYDRELHFKHSAPVARSHYIVSDCKLPCYSPHRNDRPVEETIWK